MTAERAQQPLRPPLLTPPPRPPRRDIPSALAEVDAVYRTEGRRVYATLVRLLGGDFDLAEEAAQEAFAAAAEQWPSGGVPANPRAWLVAAGRFKGLDALRRRARFDAAVAEFAHRLGTEVRVGVRDAVATPPVPDDTGIEDDRLRLIFTCCHPALPTEARVALTLREVCGLTTEAVARAFLVAPATMAQRIVRAKAKIREVGISYEVPSAEDLPERLDAVLAVIYLVFTEEYAAVSSGDALTRGDLSGEAVRLGRLLADLMPDEPEVGGLLALMLLTGSRRAARTEPATGDLVLLEDQDRSRWDRAMIREGIALVERTLRGGAAGPYALQAAIAAVHAEAEHAAETDWPQIVALYDLLLRASPSPVVALNRAVAVAMRDGPAAGLALLDPLLAGGALDDYHLAHAARADLLRRQGKAAEAGAAYSRALSLVTSETERRFLERRLREAHTKV